MNDLVKAGMRTALGGALALALLAGAWAQTPLTPVRPDPEAARLLDRVNSLEQDLQKATAENERLQHDLSESQAQVAKLQQIVDGAQAAQAASDTGAGAPTPKQEVSLPASKDPEAAYKHAYQLVVQGAYPAAEQAFRDFIEVYAGYPQAPEAHYWLGQSLLAQNKNADAADEFLLVVKKFPRSARAPEAYLNVGAAFRALGQSAQACAVFKDVAVKFPKASASVKSRAAARARSCAA